MLMVNAWGTSRTWDKDVSTTRKEVLLVTLTLFRYIPKMQKISSTASYNDTPNKSYEQTFKHSFLWYRGNKNLRMDWQMIDRKTGKNLTTSLRLSYFLQ